MKKLVNEESESGHRISARVKEYCIRIDEVTAALKTVKRHKAAALSGL